MASVPPAVTREEGCGDTASALTRLSHPRSHVLKLHATAHTVPSLQLPPSREEKKRRKPQSERKPGERLVIQFPRDVAGHPREPPARGAPPARHGRRSRREMKLQRLSLQCLAEHKNPALKTKKGKRGTGRAAGAERGSDARRPQKQGRRNAEAHTALTHISISEEFLGKINAKSVIKVYLCV